MLALILNFLLAHSLLLAEPSPVTIDSNQKVLQHLPFDNVQDFKDAQKGFIAPLLNDGLVRTKEGQVVWNLELYDFLKDLKASAPDSVNPSLWRQGKIMAIAGLFKVADQIYQVRSADISNMTIIEGQEGLIIIDPLLSRETAKAALELYYAHRPKKPVKAVIYSHSHADHFGGVKGVISQEAVNEGKVKVIAPDKFIEAALDENVMAGNAMGRRATYMYGTSLKPGIDGQVTTGLGLATSTGEITLILPTDLVKKTGQEMTIEGIKFVFLMAPGSEAPSEMLFFLPELKALCAAEDATHTMHNLYTLRGAKVRDARAWAQYLNQAIDLFGSQTEVVFAQHHWPKWGNAHVIDFLEKQRDLYKYIHDQTLHMANQGYTMVEIAEKIQLPESLAKEWYNRGYYGSLNHNAKAVYDFYLGWFDGNPSHLHPLPPVKASQKYVEYMGGGETILKKAKVDFDKGEYRWVATALNHLVFAEPSNQEAKNLLASTLEQLGYQSENATWRNFYLSGAKDLRQGVNKSIALTSASLDVITAMPIESFFDYLAIKLNGPKASQNPMSLNFKLDERDYLLQIKNGVLNYFANKRSAQADLSLQIHRSDLNAVILKQTSFEKLANEKKIRVEGKENSLKTFLSLFDDFDPWFNIVEPILSL